MCVFAFRGVFFIIIFIVFSIINACIYRMKLQSCAENYEPTVNFSNIFYIIVKCTCLWKYFFFFQIFVTWSVKRNIGKVLKCYFCFARYFFPSGPWTIEEIFAKPFLKWHILKSEKRKKKMIINKSMKIFIPKHKRHYTICHPV